MKKIIQTDNAPKPVGPYSQAVKAGNYLYCSGQISIDPKTDIVHSGDAKAEAQRIMENIKAVLAAANMELGHIVKTTIFLTSMSDFATVNEVYASYFKGDFPACSTVAVAALPKGVKVEIEIVGYKE